MTSSSTTTTGSTAKMDSHADIVWDEHGIPRSQVYDDVYFSKVSGISETEYVFLQHNDLPQRWQHPQRETAVFRIIETGFGTGLNFLCAWKHFVEQATTCAQLEFVSIEKFPLTPDAMRHALMLWPCLASQAQELMEVYPKLSQGFHRFVFAQGRVALTLIIDDIEAALPAIEGKTDAWFLDGFAPSKNPDMWSDTLFRHMSRLSGSMTTVATFTAAGIVKRGLRGAGFDIQKVPGFGSKREMLKGQFKGTQGPCSTRQSKPWLSGVIPISTPIRSAIVVGGGLAGCSVARSLAEKGILVHLLEAQSELASGASGNAQGIFYTKLGLNTPEYNAFYTAGMRLSLTRCHQWLSPVDFDACSVVQLAFNEQELIRQQRLVAEQAVDPDWLRWLSKEDIGQRLGIEVNAPGGLWFLQSGWVHPPALCRALVNHENIQIHTQQRLQRADWDGAHWRIHTTRQQWEADGLIVACAHQAVQLAQCQHLPIKPIAGQVTQWDSTQDCNANRSKTLDTLPEQAPVICGQGYIAPARQGFYCTGASYRLRQSESSMPLTADPPVTHEDHQHNLSQLQQSLPKAPIPSVQQCFGRVSIRATSPDYWPVVGPLLLPETCRQQYPHLTTNAKHPYLAPAHYLPQFGVSLCHGSRGLCSTLLSGEILAASLTGSPLPVSQRVFRHLSPNRFLIRNPRAAGMR